MGPGIGRSIQAGLSAAQKSWAGIAFFVGAWILFFIPITFAVILSNPPAALFQEQTATPGPTTPPSVTPATPPEAPPAATPASPAAAAPTTPQTTDLFNQLSTTPPPASSPAPVATVAQPTTSQQSPESERDRQILDWIGRSWPILLLGALVFMAGNLWLSGGQIGYLAKRVMNAQAPISEWWVTGTRAFGSLLAGSVLSLLATGAIALLVALTVGLFSLLAKVFPIWLLVVLGLLFGVALVVGLVWVAIRISFWFIAIVIERLGPIAGLKRSFQVTRGRWWQVTGLSFLMGLMYYGVFLAFTLLERLSRLPGGGVAVALSTIMNLVGALATVYIGFALLAGYIRFYEDAKSASAPMV